MRLIKLCVLNVVVAGREGGAQVQIRRMTEYPIQEVSL